MRSYKQTFFVVFVAALCILFLAAERISAQVVPASQPDRIILSWSGDTATTQSVTWRTSINVIESFAEIVESGDSSKFAANKKNFSAVRELVESNNMSYHSHSITFTDLKPDTMYCYRVGQESNWSEWFTFTTGSQSEQPFSFLYFGDAQSGLNTGYPRLVRQAFLTAPEAKFAIFVGDLVNRGENEHEWDAWFSAKGFLAAMYPIMPVPGNHEHTGRILTKLWRPLFTLPENGPDSMKESCYTFVYNGVRMIGLDSTKDAHVRGENETSKWLENVLNNNKSRWVVVYFHHPIYSPGKGRNEVIWRTAIKPILDKYQVDLVLQGHDHVYSRTGLHTPNVDVVDLTNAQELDPNSQTVYVSPMSGDKMYLLDEKPFFVKSLTDTQLFQIVKIDGNVLKYTAKTATGEVVDAFVIEKNASEKKLRQ